jgi:hypothetical protein
MFSSFSPLHVVVGTGPCRELDGLSGEEVEVLTEELGAGEAPMYPNMFSAALDHGSDSGIPSDWQIPEKLALRA